MFLFSHLLSLLSVYISTHAFFTILFHYFLFGIFHFLTSLCSFFITCNIFLLFFICFFAAFIRIFVFIFSYVYFVNFYEWKNCFLSFFRLFTTYRGRDALRLLTDKHRRIIFFFEEYIEILFSLPFFMYFFSFPHLF